LGGVIICRFNSLNWYQRAVNCCKETVTPPGFPAIIRRVRLGSVNAEILLEIAPGVEAVSVITSSSAEGLQLKEARQAYVTIESSDVMVAVDD
jgi:molybdopterin-binding protein